MYSLLLASILVASAFGAQCPPQGSMSYLIAHETDCDKFYICAHGTPVLQTCPEGTHFSTFHLTCQNPLFAGCDSTRPALCPDWDMLPKPHPESCNKFYVCQHGDPQFFDCPQGLEFNAELMECVWPAESNCNISQDSQEDTQTEETVQNGGCKQGDVSPHVECSKYYVCDHGVEITMDCPAGLLWNAKESFCDWPASAGCQQ